MYISRNQHSAQHTSLHRCAFTTIELLVSLSIASVLTLGLSSAIFIAGRSLDVPEQTRQEQASFGNDLGRLRENFADALAIDVNQDAGTISLVVADRDEDQIDDTINYRLSFGSLLEESTLYGTRTIATGVTDLSLSTNSQQPSRRTIKQAYLAKAISLNNGSTQNLIIPFPSGSQAGDLLIVTLALDSAVANVALQESGWNLITTHVGSGKTLAAWFRYIAASETSVTAQWQSNSRVVASVLRISKAAKVDPIESLNVLSGDYSSSDPNPNSPPVSLEKPGGLILQILTADKNSLANQTGGLNSHMTCVYDEQANLALTCSVFQAGDNVGIFDAANSYHLTGSSDYVMFGLGITAEE